MRVSVPSCAASPSRRRNSRRWYRWRGDSLTSCAPRRLRTSLRHGDIERQLLACCKAPPVTTDGRFPAPPGSGVSCFYRQLEHPPLAKLLLGGGIDPWLLAGLLYLGSGFGLAAAR